jgi:DNA-binding transcriptional MerR regulator
VTTWSIGETAAKCGLSQHTLRWYEAAPQTTEL